VASVVCPVFLGEGFIFLFIAVCILQHIQR